MQTGKPARHPHNGKRCMQLIRFLRSGTACEPVKIRPGERMRSVYNGLWNAIRIRSLGDRVSLMQYGNEVYLVRKDTPHKEGSAHK